MEGEGGDGRAGVRVHPGEGGEGWGVPAGAEVLEVEETVEVRAGVEVRSPREIHGGRLRSPQVAPGVVPKTVRDAACGILLESVDHRLGQPVAQVPGVRRRLAGCRVPFGCQRAVGVVIIDGRTTGCN
jgi:hypothetical protein